MNYSPRTEQAYVRWTRHFDFHKMRHPREMGKPEVEGFLMYLVAQRGLSKATGHYGDIFARNVGDASPYGLGRGVNTNQLMGGLLMAPFVE